MSDPNAIDLQTWRDVVTAIEVALSMDGAKVERALVDDEHDAAMEVSLPSGEMVLVEVTEVPEVS